MTREEWLLAAAIFLIVLLGAAYWIALNGHNAAMA
jgi:hypothetical protein